MRRWLFAGSLIAALAGAAAAQPAPDPPPPPRDARDDAGWRLYHEAFAALLRGQRTEARRLTAQLQREHAGHPAAALVEGASLAVEPPAPRGRREEPTSGATAE